MTDNNQKVNLSAPTQGGTGPEGTSYPAPDQSSAPAVPEQQHASGSNAANEGQRTGRKSSSSEARR
jgi:hypothetical protein